jgi:hypothetical protein
MLWKLDDSSIEVYYSSCLCNVCICNSITQLSITNTTYTNQNIPLSFTLNENASWIAYNLDNQGNVTLQSNTTLSSLSFGSHQIVVYANDTSRNMGKTDVYFDVQKEDFTSLIIIGIMVVIVVGVLLLVSFKKYKRKVV